MFSTGLEVEAIINLEHFDSNKIQGYHSGEFNLGEYWKAESDSSLEKENYFEDETPIEFISKRVFGKKAMFDSLHELKTKILKNKPLDQILQFNSSCGAHVHFSFPFKTSQHIHCKEFYKMRNMFGKLIEGSNILPSDTKQRILDQYNRNYSQKLDKQKWLNKGERRQEINFTKEDKTGLEWRSPNLLGVITWEQLYEVYEIIWKCIESLYKSIQRYTVTETFKFKEKEINEVFKNV